MKNKKKKNKKIPYPFFNTGCPLRASRIIIYQIDDGWVEIEKYTNLKKPTNEYKAVLIMEF